MKLGFLIYAYFPYGGQQRDFRRLVEECIARGHEVVIYTLKWQGNPLSGATTKIVPVKALSRLRLYERFSNWTREDLDLNPCDAVVGFNKMPGLDVYFAADPCFAEKASSQRRAYYKFTPRFHHFKHNEEAVFGADSKVAILYLSPMQLDSYEHHYPGCSKRMYQVPPGIDRDRMVTDAAPLIRKRFRKEYNLGNDELLVLQIGSGFKVKGVDRSLRAIASLPQELLERTRYLLIGQDDPDRYLKMARTLGIENRFTVLPGQDDIPRFMLGADLLLHPAYSESAGYTLLEATISGLPVLTTATCGYAYHIEAAESGMVCSEPFKQAELNEKLVEALTSRERARWIQNGFDYGKQEELFTLADIGSDLIEKVASRVGKS